MSLIFEIIGYAGIIGVSLLMIYAFVKVLMYALNAVENSDDD